VKLGVKEKGREEKESTALIFSFRAGSVLKCQQAELSQLLLVSLCGLLSLL
jgi:hypothetical protein